MVTLVVHGWEVLNDHCNDFVGRFICRDSPLIEPGEWLPPVVPLAELVLSERRRKGAIRVSANRLVEAHIELVNARVPSVVSVQLSKQLGVVAQVEDPIKNDVISEIQCLPGGADDQKARVTRALSSILVREHLTAEVVLVDHGDATTESLAQRQRRRRLA